MVQKQQLGDWGLILGLSLIILYDIGSNLGFVSISILICKILGLGEIMSGGFQAIKSCNKELDVMLWS